MYARVTTWQGDDGEAMRRGAAAIKERASSGPPEGVPSVGFTLLVDAERKRAMAIALFETEDDLRQGDATLRAMDPPEPGMGQRSTVDTFEVMVDVRLHSPTGAS